MSGYYGRSGARLELMEWARMADDPESRRVAYDSVGELLPGHAVVSTVWIGIDMSFGDGPPLIFETMIFGGTLDGEQWRYSTEAEALAGHAAAVALVKAAILA